jgi:hypothetical protein
MRRDFKKLCRHQHVETTVIVHVYPWVQNQVEQAAAVSWSTLATARQQQPAAKNPLQGSCLHRPQKKNGPPEAPRGQTTKKRRPIQYVRGGEKSGGPVSVSVRQTLSQPRQIFPALWVVDHVKKFQPMNSTKFILFDKYYPILNQLGLKDSSRDFQLYYIINYFLIYI